MKTETCVRVTTTIVQHRDVWQQVGDAAFSLAIVVVILCLGLSIIYARRAQKP